MNGVGRNWMGTRTTAQAVRRQLSEVSVLNSMYMGGWDPPKEHLLKQLGEIDPHLLQSMIDQAGYEIIDGFGLGFGIGAEAERERAVREARRLFRYTPLAQWSIWLWTGWGLGDKTTVTPDDAKAQDTWSEFWEADRNAAVFGGDVLAELSDWLLVTGERFMLFFSSTQNGRTTARTIEPERITKILKNPEDASEPWFYEETRLDTSELSADGSTITGQKVYHADWQLYFTAEEMQNDDVSDRTASDIGSVQEAVNAKWDKLVEAKKVDRDARRSDIERTSDDMPGTVAVMLHIAHNRKDPRSLRGWPITITAGPWVRAHKRWMESRLNVAVSVASFVRRYKTQGGSRAVKALQASIASTLSSTNFIDRNPPPVGGSSETINKAVDVEDLPLKTGAMDAKADNNAFTWHALIGMGVFPTSAGLDTARWATALEMDKAQSMVFQRYQTFWAAQFRKVAKIVLGFAELFGDGRFQTKSVQVSVDSFSLADFPQMATAIGNAVTQALVPLVTAGSVDPSTARVIARDLWRVILQTLGISTDETTSDEAFLIGAPPAQQPEKPPEQQTEPNEVRERMMEILAANLTESLRSAVEFALMEAEEARSG